jgi:hypothetical protein
MAISPLTIVGMIVLGAPSPGGHMRRAFPLYP